MERIETWYNQDLAQAVKVKYIDGNVFSQDSGGNRIGVNLFKNGEPFTVTGTISANVIRADGATVAVSGQSSQNSAWVDLPQAAYAVPGSLSVVIKSLSNGYVTTLCAVVANVYISSTDTAVDPGTIIPSIQALIAEIENTRATIPQDYTALSNAVTYDAITYDAVEQEFIPKGMVCARNGSGTTTTGKAWNKNGTTVTGEQYAYISYDVPSSYAGNVVIIYGHSWGEQWPLVSFYDSNNTLISYAAPLPDTAYKGFPVIIPPAIAKIVINCRSNASATNGVYFCNITDLNELLRSVQPFHVELNATMLATYTSLKNVKNLDNNIIYSLSDNAYTVMTNLPFGLNTYATIVKFNGVRSGLRAYTLYLCANEYNVWIGFETASVLHWHLIKGELKRKYLLIGDSYGDGYSHDGNNSGWCQYFVDEMGLSASEYESKHQGGASFGGGGYRTLLLSASGTGFTDIVVLGGFNDYSNTSSSILSGISAFCASARASFPTARIHVGCVGWIKQGTGESAYQNWQEVRDAITGTVLPAYQTCAKYGADYINFSEYLLTDALMTPTDGYHPGEEGNKAIAHGIVNSFATGCACLPFKSVLKG